MGFALSALELTSPSFKMGQRIMQKHTGEGENISPPLSWKNIPEHTKSFAIVCYDPDAPLIHRGNVGFVHWVLYNIPKNIHQLEENTGFYTQGLNDQKKPGYTGPMPPKGHGNHQYYFFIFALNEDTNLSPNLTMGRLFMEIEPYVIGINRLVGVYQRT